MRRKFALNLKCIVSSPGDVLTLACVSRGKGVVACVSCNLTFCPITHTTLPEKRAKKCDYVLVFEAKSPKFKGAHPRTICYRHHLDQKSSKFSQIQYYEDFTITQIWYCKESLLCIFEHYIVILLNRFENYIVLSITQISQLCSDNWYIYLVNRPEVQIYHPWDYARLDLATLLLGLLFVWGRIGFDLHPGCRILDSCLKCNCLSCLSI